MRNTLIKILIFASIGYGIYNLVPSSGGDENPPMPGGEVINTVDEDDEYDYEDNKDENLYAEDPSEIVQLLDGNLREEDREEALRIMYFSLSVTAIDKINKLGEEGFTQEELEEAKDILNNELSNEAKMKLEKIYE